jgi:SAM-dependent methyltransferase
MKIANLLIQLNKRFKAPVHPFNLNNNGVMSYSEWQYGKGGDTIKFYLELTDEKELFLDKTVLDVGCGAAGKTVYYASKGVKKIFGLEILGKYREEAEALAKEKGHADKFEFICADAAATGLPAESIDTIIMNDAMEHVDDPEGVLRECARVLRPGGRLYVNFPPYYHPYGAHLSDAIFIPWVQLLFSEKTLIEAYKRLVADLPDGGERIEFRISRAAKGKGAKLSPHPKPKAASSYRFEAVSRRGHEHENSTRAENGTTREYFSYINKMTIRKFKGILKSLDSGNFPMKRVYYKEAPLRSFLAVPAKIPLLKEMLVKMVVVVFEKIM